MPPWVSVVGRCGGGVFEGVRCIVAGSLSKMIVSCVYNVYIVCCRNVVGAVLVVLQFCNFAIFRIR